VELAEAIGKWRAAAYSAAGSASLASGDPAFMDYLERAIDAARADGDLLTAAMAADTLCVGHLLFGRPCKCRDLADEMMREVSAHSTVWQQQFRKDRLLAAFLFDSDDTTVIAEAGPLARHAPGARTRHQSEALLLLAHAHQGDDDAALGVAAEMRALTDGDPTGEATGRWALAEAHWLAGRADIAYDVAAGAAGLPVAGFPAHVLAAAVGAWAAVDSGQPVAAPAPVTGFTNLAGAVAEYEGLSLLATDPAGAAERLDVAADVWATLAPRYAVRARLGYALALLAQGERDDAVACLGELESRARELHSVPLERRARAELRRVGVRPITERRATGSRLSPTEFVVLDLVARGLTSRQIARRLWISPATVETHINNARRVLNASTRLQAAIAAAAERDREGQPTRHTLTNDWDTFQRVLQEWQARYGFVLDLASDAEVHRSDRASGVVTDMTSAARVVSAAGSCAAILVYLDDALDAPLAVAVREALQRVGTVREVMSDASTQLLSAGERELLDRLAGGASLNELADSMGVSRRTVERQLRRIRETLGVATNAEAVALARGNKGSDA
jgi:DNA-binding CsgD family transcriptional regulator